MQLTWWRASCGVTAASLSVLQPVQANTAWGYDSAPVLSAVKLYESATCSGDAIQVKLVHDESCVKDGTDICEPVQVGATTFYRARDCTQTDLGFAYNAFPTAPALLMRQFEENTACGTLTGGMIFLADGVCHPNAEVGSSYKVTPGEGDTPTTVATFADQTCDEPMGEEISASSSMIGNGVCIGSVTLQAFNFYSVPAGSPLTPWRFEEPPKLSAVKLYDSPTCSGDAIQVKLVHDESCVKDAAVSCEPVPGTELFRTLDCTQTDLLLAYEAFPSAPALLMRQYQEDTNCGTLTGGMIFLADGVCHPNAEVGSSYKVTPGEGDTPTTVATFADQTCDEPMGEEISASSSMISNGACIGSVKLQAFNFYSVPAGSPLTPWRFEEPPKLSAVKLYDSPTCSGDAIQVKLVHDESCVKDGTDICEPVQVGATTFYRARDCTQTDLGFAYNAFPTAPALLMRQFEENTACGTLTGGMIFLADGVCHPNAEVGSSYKVTPGEGDTPTTVATFADQTCDEPMGEEISASSSMIGNGVCIGSVTLQAFNFYSVPRSGSSSIPGITATTFYDRDSCDASPSVQYFSFTYGSSCTTSTSYGCSGTDGYQHSTRDCTSDYFSYASRAYGETPYILVERYSDSTCSADKLDVIAYTADGTCHIAEDGSSGFVAVPNSDDGTATLRVYTSWDCSGEQSYELRITRESLEWNLCTDGKRMFAGGIWPSRTGSTPQPTSQPPSWPEPTWATPTPTEAPTTTSDVEARLDIMFPGWLWDPQPPRVFISDGSYPRRHNPNYYPQHSQGDKKLYH